MGRFGRSKSRDVDSIGLSSADRRSGGGSGSQGGAESDGGSYLPPQSTTLPILPSSNTNGTAELDPVTSMTEEMNSSYTNEGRMMIGESTIQQSSTAFHSNNNNKHDNHNTNNFVTQPPKLVVKGLTGKISTLFRRESSRERPAGATSSSLIYDQTSLSVDMLSLSSSVLRQQDHDHLGSLETQTSPQNSYLSTSSSRKKGNNSKQQQQQQEGEISSYKSREKFRDEIDKQYRFNNNHSKDNSKKTSTTRQQQQTKSTLDRSTPKNNVSSSKNNNFLSSSDDDNESVGMESVCASVASRAGSTTKRIFYSSNQDDDSDDSYESRASRVSQSSRASRVSQTSRSNGNGGRRLRSNSTSGFTSGDGLSQYTDEETYYTLSEAQSAMTENGDGDGGGGGIRRFRGFSTSIKSLFLDEPLVCAAMGCFGLILSNRTEYLLQLRNERRGTQVGGGGRRSGGGIGIGIGKIETDARKKSPSRIVGMGLILTLLLMFSTYIIWGFGSGVDSGDAYLNEYMGGYSDNFDNSERKWWDDYLVNDDDRYGGGGRNYNRNNNKYNNNNNDDNNNNNGNNYNNNNDDVANNNNNNGDNYNNDDNQRRTLDRNYHHNETTRTRSFSSTKKRKYATTTINKNKDYDQMPQQLHAFHGILKIRDYQENIWYPILDFVEKEMKYRAATASNTAPIQVQTVREVFTRDSDHHIRRNEETTTEAYNGTNGGNDWNNEMGGSYHQRNIAADLRIGLLFVFLLFLGILGRRRRMRTRFYLVRARAQDDHLYYASSDEAALRRAAADDTREDQYEGACSHTLCGCYPSDEMDAQPTDEDVGVTDAGLIRRTKQPHHEDVVARCFNGFLYACCGALCKCWFQCLSICALAQEAREIRLLVPPRYQRIDFITHQPFHEYQEAVNDLRRGWLGKSQGTVGILPHYNALSRFSRWILVLSILCVSIIVATLYLNPNAAFSWQDMVVLVATFVQSFLVLFIVHGIFHKSDLSLDAVIKMFTAGFVVAVPSAFLFEGLLVNIVLFVVVMVYYLTILTFGDDFGDWIFSHWRSFWILGELFNAFVVAALVEELCKYYTFRSVEHPDLVFLTGLQREKQDEGAVEGGLVQYPFASHQIQDLTKGMSHDDASSSCSSYRSSDKGSSRRNKKMKRHLQNMRLTGTTDAEYDEDENDVRTHRQRAMAITTAMISVAVGLACAENFIYVFVLGGTGMTDEDDPQADHKNNIVQAWIVLFFRSIFPVHALAAALQSINIIRKFVEADDQGGHRIGVGRVILPAVLLHGSFDAILMAINVYIETSWERYLEENDGVIVEGKEPYNSLAVNFIAWTSVTLIMIIGLAWYFNENRHQRDRLIALEENAIGYNNQHSKKGISKKASKDGTTTNTTTPKKKHSKKIKSKQHKGREYIV